MRLFLRLVLLLLGLVPWAIRAQAQTTAFSCDGTLYQIRQVTNGGVNTSYLYKVDRSSAAYTTTAVNINGGSNNLGILLNALAYNSQDGYMYALTTPGATGSNANTPVYLYKIGQDGISRVGNAITVNGTNLAITVATGTFDKTGNYYFTSQNTGGTADYNLYRIAPTSNTPTAATRVALSSNTTMYDVAFNPIDGYLYGSNWVGSLFRVNQTTSPATVTTISTTPAANQTTSNAVGSVFFDVAGNLYAYSNGTVGTNPVNGAFYQVNTSTGTYTNISSITPASVSDGASCINPGNSIDVTKEVTNVRAVNATTFNISYALRVRNTYTATLDNVQVSDILKGNVSTSTNVPFPTATSISIVTAPAVTNYDGAALVANSGYTGLNGGGSLLSGSQPLTAGQRALITYTVQVQFSAGNVPNTPRNNTAYATSTSTGPNQGYTLTTTDVLRTPNDLVANDASTNSADFPDLTTTTTNGTPDAPDTPSPTPVTFAPSISGVVFEDVNYGGGAGRSQGTSNGVGRPDARVELYNGTTGAYINFTTTAADGSYSFIGLSAGGSYTVRVVSSSVTSSRNSSATGLVGVQTYRATATAAAGTTPDLNRVGGEYPARVEAANGASGTLLASLTPVTGTTAAESITTITLSNNNAPAVGISFGYNFDTVVNTNNAGQGSLRQFITNANALDNTGLDQEPAITGGNDPIAGVETSIFMIPDGAAHPGLAALNLTTSPGLASQLTNGVAVITPTTALPAIGGTYGASTTIDGTTQTQNVGDTNSAILGTGGTVGTTGLTLDKVNGPEVQLTGSISVGIGLDVAATGTNTTIQGLAIVGFGNSLDDNNNANIQSAANNLTINQNVLGSGATAFTQPSTPTNADNVRLLVGTAGISISNNLIGFSNSKGITVGPAVTNISITDNEIRSNGLNGASYDGIDVQGSVATITGNLLTGTSGQGIDSYRSVGSNTITSNTVTDNGRGTSAISPVETPGVRIYGANNTISQNIISNNYGAGIMLEGTNGTSAAVSTTTISQNSIFGNGSVTSRRNGAATGQLGIDLEVTGNNEAAGTSPYVTTNSTTTTGANGLLNFPVLTSATVVGTNLVLSGYAKPNASIELFIAQPNTLTTGSTTGNNFGQGRTYLTTLTAGSTGGAGYSGSINGFNQGSDTNANAFTFTIPLTVAQQALVTSGTPLTSTATLGGATSEFSGNVATTVTAPLTGYVYEDVNYGGGLGRSRATAGSSAVTRPGAKVELYDASGNYVSTAITDANGLYSFNVVAGSYTVRVLNNSVLSSRGQAAATTTYSGDATVGYTNTLVPVQTYNGATNRVGGENPAYTDAAANNGSQTLGALSSGTSTPESIATATVTQGASSNAGPDFGYNFDTVVNTNDVATVSGTNAQGSLRQFILNSNVLTGESTLAQVYTATGGATTALSTGVETSIFMIPNGTAVAGQRAGLTSGFTTTPNSGSGSAATITLAVNLPTVSGPATAIDGSTQTRSTNDTNAAVTTAGAESTGPEVFINASSVTGGSLGVAISGSSDRVIGMGIYGANSGVGIGVSIASGAVGTIIQNSTINNNGANISFSGTTAASPSAATISNNVIRESQRSTADGIELNGNNSNMTISGNQILRNAGFGIDFIGGANSGNTITNNVISSNGTATGTDQLSGIGLRSTGSNNNVISGNTFTNNTGAGILARPGTTGNIFSQNSFSNNGNANSAASGFGLAIDLMATGATGNNGDGVTRNDNGDTDTGANGLINFPIIQTAVLNNGVLTVTGYARPNARVELYLASDDPTHFGEGTTYLTTFTQAASAGTTGSVVTGAASSYSGTLTDGLNQGTDNTNTFTFTFTPTATQLALLQASGALLTSTATLTATDGVNNFGTSEFSGNTRVFQAPVPNDVTNVSVADNTVTPVVLNPNVSGTATGLVADVTTTTANTIVNYTVNPIATGGTLYYNGTAVAAATVVPAANIGLLTFVPTRGFTGNATFTYTATDANGLTSNSHNTSGTSSSGAATYTIPVTAAADVTASLTGGTTLNSGQPTGYYTATFTNLGPDAASSVTRSVTLPVGASLTTAQQNAITSAYSGTTFSTSGSQTVINFPTATTLANGAANSYRFVFTAPTAAGSSSIVATTSTTTSEGTNVAANSATLALTTTAITDVQATITASAATVTPGTAASFTATFTNNSTQAAAGVVETVQLPLGLTPTTVGGQAGTTSGTTVTYGSVATLNTATGLLTYSATTLAGGGTTSSVIAFTMPTSGIVTGTASITTTTTESNTTNNVGSASIAAGARFDLATTINGPTSAVAGSPVTLSVTTTNNGPQAVAGAVETVQLPAGLNTTAAPNVFISNGGTYNNTTGVVTFPALGTLPSGQTVTNTITFLAPTSAFSPVATITPSTATAAGETNSANNTAYLNGATSTAGAGTLAPSAATSATANIYAILNTTSTIVASGTQVTYNTGVGNAGPATATSVTAQLQLIPNLSTSTLTVGGQTGTLSGTTITFGSGASATTYNTTTGLLNYATTTSLPSGSTGTTTVVVTVPNNVGNNGQLLATMSVGSATSDAVPGDNVKAVAVTVQPVSDLATTISGPTSGVVPGQSVTYTATFTNIGPSAASVTAETVQLPAGLTTSTLTVGGQAGTLAGTTITFASGATYSTTTGIVTLPAIASDAVGAVQSFNLTFTAPAQSYVVSSAVSSATPDSTPANNAASVATTVTQTADVAVSITGPATAVIGNPVTYIVASTNNGPGTATSVVPTVQLPTGLTIAAAGPGGYTYNSTSGLLTFPTIANLQSGVSVENYVTFTMPNATGGQINGVASASTSAYDNVASNNTAALTTSVAPTTTTSTDLLTTLTPTGTSVAPGSTVVYTVAYRNAGTTNATGVVPTVSLPTGLATSTLQVGGVTGTLANGVITFSSGPANGATYDVTTGLLTFPTLATLAPSSSGTSYTVSFPAPAVGQLIIFSAVSSNTTDSDPSNNRANSNITINSAFDLTTSITGPVSALVGSQNVYTVTTTNNGPSMVSSATQTVTLPSGLTTSTLLVAGQAGTLSGTTITFPNASYNTSTGVLTFASISNLAPGANGAVTNTITVTMPSSGSLTAQATVSTAASGETNPTNNTASITTVTSTLSLAPVAENIVNNLQTPQGNTAVALPISPLYATDADGTISYYTLTSLPLAAQGMLYYNGAVATLNQQINNPSLLSFDPANTFVGNAFFTYTATDNNSVVSNTALYTIPVAADIASTYTAYNSTKGGTTKYVTGDVLAQLTDLNTAAYTSGGIIYDATTGVLQAGAANGLPTTGTNAVLATTGPAGNTSNTLPAGVSLDAATGRIYVSDANQLVNYSTARTYSVYVNTTDLNGGINQALATFTIGAYPLPVSLTEFTAVAVRNRDALLSWSTASETRNDYFDVERSFDGTTFTKVGHVAGHGTTAAASTYSLTDAGVAAQATGPVYYRLRQVDTDGTATYSPLRTVSFTKVELVKLALFPNPVATSTNLDLRQLPTSASYQAQLLDATGRQVRTWTLAGGVTQPLELTDLASGSYLLVVTGQQPDGSLLKQTLRVTKE